MTDLRRILLLSACLGVTALGVVGCAASGSGAGSGSSGPAGSSGSAGGSSATSPAPEGGAPAALTVARVGGLAPAMAGVSVPAVSLWADGLVITPGVQVQSYPAPALPAVTAAHVDPAAMPRVLETVAAGLDGLPHDFGMPPTADVPATEVTWRNDGKADLWVAESLGVGDEEPSELVTPEQIQARERLTQVVEYAGAVAAGTLDSVPVSQPEPYRPAAWYVWSAPYQVLDADESARRWPGPRLSAVDGQWTCQVVSGADAVAVTEALTTATEATPWRSAGQQWSVLVRPVLPGEPDTCPSVS